MDDPTRLDLHLHIERVVLDGASLAPGSLSAFRDALQAELARLLGPLDAGTIAEGSRLAPPVTWNPADRPERLGRAVARSASRSLAGPVRGITGQGKGDRHGR